MSLILLAFLLQYFLSHLENILLCLLLKLLNFLEAFLSELFEGMTREKRLAVLTLAYVLIKLSRTVVKLLIVGPW